MAGSKKVFFFFFFFLSVTTENPQTGCLRATLNERSVSGKVGPGYSVALYRFLTDYVGSSVCV